MNMEQIAKNCYGTENLTETQIKTLNEIMELAKKAGLSMCLIELETYCYTWYPLDVKKKEKYDAYHPDGILIKFSNDKDD